MPKQLNPALMSIDFGSGSMTRLGSARDSSISFRIQRLDSGFSLFDVDLSVLIIGLEQAQFSQEQS